MYKKYLPGIKNEIQSIVQLLKWSFLQKKNNSLIKRLTVCAKNFSSEIYLIGSANSAFDQKSSFYKQIKKQNQFRHACIRP